MRESLELGFPGSSIEYDKCVQTVREALLDVERPKRATAIFVMLSMWVWSGLLDHHDSLIQDSELVAELAQFYQNETSEYWGSINLA
jgi:hypothetical protein